MTKEEKIFNEIYDSTYRRVLIYVTAKCSDMHDIEDILQETYTEVYSVLLKKGTDYIVSPTSFVLKVAKRKVYLHYTLKERIRGISLNTEDEFERELIDTIPDELDVEDAICSKELFDRVAVYIFSKPLVIQKIFTLYYTLDMTISEIAKELSVGESYVKNKLYRTLNELKKQYGGEEK